MSLKLTFCFALLFSGVASIEHTAQAAQHPPEIVRDKALHKKLEDVFLTKGAAHIPRTYLKVDNAPKYINRLITEASPYLLQHAHNPVDWHPWSNETLEKAAKENKPIFLSVGYATCFWCHAMARESFDQEDVAEILNRNFISIKVDREESPDIDRLYFTATQLQQGQAGWPNTVWLTPDGRPFHTGTYFTKEELKKTSLLIGSGWKSSSSRPQIVNVAKGLSSQVMDIMGAGTGNSVPLDQLYVKATNNILGQHNDLEGGFSESNQFPHENYMLFLLDQWRRGGSEDYLEVVQTTLNAIAAGGLHDHIGGGFHRYAIDPSWQTPHFEKMLYNQALLSRVFLETWEATSLASYRRAVERTLQYVTRDMMAPNGAFYAAEDAESINADGNMEEGAFYRWSPNELKSTLNDKATVFAGLDDTNSAENRENITLLLDPEATHDFAKLDGTLDQLFILRSARRRPFKDTKIIAGWNGLIVRSLAAAGAAFGEKSYIEYAERAGEAVWKELWKDGRLLRFSVDGGSKGEGQLEDYAWLALGYVAIADAKNDPFWLERAALITNVALEKFSTGTGRMKQAILDGPLGPVFGAVDDSVPSPESSMLELLGLLVHRTGDLAYYSKSTKLTNALSTIIARRPENLTYALMASLLSGEGETTQRQVRGNGNVSIHLSASKLILDIKEGWHLSANIPGYEYLIGTNINGAIAEWPVGRKLKLGFATKEAFVYEGRLEIPITQMNDKLLVTIQACSDKICLAPEVASFRILKNDE